MNRRAWEIHIESPPTAAKRASAGARSRKRGNAAETAVVAEIPGWRYKRLYIWQCGPASTPVGRGLARVHAPGAVDFFGRFGGRPVAFDVKSTSGDRWSVSKVPRHQRKVIEAFGAESSAIAGFLVCLSADTHPTWEFWRYQASGDAEYALFPLKQLADFPQTL